MLDALWQAERGPAKDEMFGLVAVLLAELRSAVFYQRSVGAPRKGDLR